MPILLKSTTRWPCKKWAEQHQIFFRMDYDSKVQVQDDALNYHLFDNILSDDQRMDTSALVFPCSIGTGWHTTVNGASLAVHPYDLHCNSTSIMSQYLLYMAIKISHHITMFTCSVLWCIYEVNLIHLTLNNAHYCRLYILL